MPSSEDDDERRHVDPVPPIALDESTGLLPGLGSARSHVVRPDQRAANRSLGELDLRALTGATVVAVQREDGRVVLPNGGERLRPGDKLALVGTNAAVEAALRRLSETLDPSDVEPATDDSPASAAASAMHAHDATD